MDSLRRRIIIVARLINYDKLPALYSAENFWNLLWKNSWESMAIFFLPLGAILSTSLIVQIEYKNNTWKQLHTLPLSYTTIFFAIGGDPCPYAAVFRSF